MAWSKNWTLPTNFNNNNPFDTNSVLTPNMFNVPYQNTLYLLDRVGTIETSITTKENALKEADKKTLYNLGAYDSVSTSNGITTITRQTGYLTINGSTDFDSGWVSSGNGYYLFSKSLVNADKSLVSNVKINCNVSNNQDTFFNVTFSNYLVCVGYSYTGESKIIIGYGGDTTASALRNHLNQNPLVIQYKLATSYTEQVIEGQPLNTLDQAQSQIVREDVESELNLATTESGDTNFVVVDTLPSGTYTISYNVVGQTTNNYGANIRDSNNTDLVVIRLNSANGIATATFTISSTSAIKINSFYGATITKVMLVKGSHAYPYVPYNANKHITNAQAELLKDEYIKSSNVLKLVDKSSYTNNGITYSISNGTIPLSGTATAYSEYSVIDFIPNESGIYSIATFNNFTSNARFVIDDLTNSTNIVSIDLSRGQNLNQIAFTLNNAHTYRVKVITNSGGVVASGSIIKPILVQGTTIPTVFEPYHGEIVHKKTIDEINARLDELGFREATISYSDTSGVSPQANSIIKQGQMCLLDFWIANPNGLNRSGTLTIPEGFRPQSDRLVRFYIYSRQLVEGGQFILTGQYLTLTLTSSGIIEYDFDVIALFAIASSSGWKIND